MFKNPKVTHLLSVAILILWGTILLYFYASGRLQNYLPPDGIFRPLILVSGIGLIILALFNLFTMGADAGGGCCHHDHGCGHDEDEAHDCCGHGHHHHHSCDSESHHHHKHEGCCGGHHNHEHKSGCGHDSNHHDHEHGDHHRAVCDHEGGHAHGVLDESGPVGKLIALTLLCVPMTYAAIKTPDRFSPNAVVNKGLYNPNYNSQARADEFSLKKKTTSGKENLTAVASTGSIPVQDTPPSTSANTASVPSPNVETKADPPVSNMAAGGAEEAKSYGNFTLQDLEAQVPKSPEGYFQLEVPEIYYTASDKEVQSVLAGQLVETIAQVLPEKVNNEAGKRVRIFKLSVQCCAADARPYSIPVEFASAAPPIVEMGWVKIKGKMEYSKENDQIIPMIRAESMEETTQPADQVIY